MSNYNIKHPVSTWFFLDVKKNLFCNTKTTPFVRLKNCMCPSRIKVFIASKVASFRFYITRCKEYRSVYVACVFLCSCSSSSYKQQYYLLYNQNNNNSNSNNKTTGSIYGFPSIVFYNPVFPVIYFSDR